MSRGAEKVPTLEERLAELLRMTGGTCPYWIAVPNEAERQRALRWLSGRRHAKLITVRTVTESEAARLRGLSMQ